MKVLFGKYRVLCLGVLIYLVFWRMTIKDVTTVKRETLRDTLNNKSGEERWLNVNTNLSETTATQTTHPKSTIGPGENGVAVDINKENLSPSKQLQYEELFTRNQFNEYASNIISVNRTLPDVRNPACKNVSYKTLPQTSIIMTFYNEAWSVLLRSIHSIINHTPPSLLREIILVDDGSNRDVLKTPLENYLKSLPPVKLVRVAEREGLIRARLIGYSHATAPVLTFLDSHIECTEGWLEPLLAPIAEDDTTVTVPLIDSIDDRDFSYHPVTATHYGVFRWRSLNFAWAVIPKHIMTERKSEVDNIRSPTMPGGLFSINRNYFTRLGTYDPGLIGWGAENIELSLKVWMCNGTLLIVPCSHVGHIFRKKFPYTLPQRSSSWKNSIRVAEVWMDDFKQFFYDYATPNLKNVSLTDRIDLRKSLNCKNFDWYYKQFLSTSVWTATDALLVGKISSMNVIGLCLDTLNGNSTLGFSRCSEKVNGNQNFYYTSQKLLRTEVYGANFDVCVSSYTDPVSLRTCDVTCKYQIWTYRNVQFYNPATGLCLALDSDNPRNSPVMTECDDHSGTYWLMNPRNTTLNKL